MTTHVLNKLGKHVPPAVHEKLKVIENRSYPTEYEFIKAIEIVLNKRYIAFYQPIILRYALRSLRPCHRKRKKAVMEPINPITPPPILTLTPNDIDNLTVELKAYHSAYSPLFNRREQREISLDYLNGLLLNIPKKSIESMVLAMNGDAPNAIRAMQNFASRGVWSDEKILIRHRKEVDITLGENNGVIIGDGSDFHKQGKNSAAVKRQYCGELGKRANCQAGVFLGYASSKGYTLLDRRLYVPEEWVDDESFAELRRKCGIPEDIEFKTKNQLTVEMLKEIYESAVLRYKWFTCDEAYGRDTEFLDAIDPMVFYFAEVPCDTQVWLKRPETHIPPWGGKGRKPTKEKLIEGEPPSQRVDKIASTLSDDQWSTHIIKEGAKGPIVAQFAFLPVINRRDKLPGKEVWLIIRRNVKTDEIKYYLSNAPIHTPITTFVWLSGMRWPIETCFKQCKQEVGMGDYQLRTWLGWHHHMTLCLLAHFFLVRIKLKLENKAPALTLEQTIDILRTLLQQRNFDAIWVIEVLNYRRRRNYAAYLSHRKKRIHDLKELNK